MNIFYLHSDPKQCAQMHCDKHCVKMILETAQLLSTAHRIIDGEDKGDNWGLYKLTHKNHPSAVWIRKNTETYRWGYDLFRYLLEEYTYRYGKQHKTGKLATKLCLAPYAIEEGTFCEPPQCMPDNLHRKNTIEAYRWYYLSEKSQFAEWNHSPVPTWWQKAKDNLPPAPDHPRYNAIMAKWHKDLDTWYDIYVRQPAVLT